MACPDSVQERNMIWQFFIHANSQLDVKLNSYTMRTIISWLYVWNL